MSKKYNYTSKKEIYFSDQFIEKGYIVVDIRDLNLVRVLRDEVVNYLIKELAVNKEKNPDYILNNFHNYCKREKLNDVRMSIFNHINKLEWTLPTYYTIGKKYLRYLVGNELVMQKQLNLSIQIPKDKTSLLPIHSDVYSGQSPFEINQWTPLVDCYKTKSMFILPPEKNKELLSDLNMYENNGGTKKMYDDYYDHFDWIKIKFGQVMLFNSSLMHGNVVNNTGETRFTFNTRYKSLFSPYTDNGKGLGNFYKPIIIKPMTKIGLSFSDPVFD